MSPIEIVLRAVGAENVADALGRVSQKAREMGQDVKGAAQEAQSASKDLDGIKKSADDVGHALDKAGKEMEGALKNVERESEGAKKNIQGIEQEAKGLGEALRNVGSENGFDHLSESADKFQGKIEEAKGKVSGLVSTLSSVRNAGMAMAAAGTGGILLSKNLQEAYSTDERSNRKMEAMLQKRGEGDQLGDMKTWADKLAEDSFLPSAAPIKETTAQLQGFGFTAKQVRDIMPGLIGQSRLYNQSLDSVGMALGKAFASGKAGNLTRIGLTLDPADIKKLTGMSKGGASFAQEQAAMLQVINKSMSDYALKMDEGLSDADKSANRLSESMEDLKISMGEGATAAQSSVNSIVVSLLKLGNASPEIAKSAGYWLTYGSYALTAGGSVLTVGAQVAITAASLKSLGVTGTGAMTAIRAAALVAGGSVLVLTLAALAAVAAIALAVYSWNVNKDKILNPTSTTSDKRSDAQFREDRDKEGFLDQTRDKAQNLSPRDKYVVMRRLSKAYLDLGEVDKAGETTDEAGTLRKGLPKNFKTADSPEGRALMDDFSGVNFGANKGARLDGEDFNDFSKSRAKDKNSKIDGQKNSIQAQADALQKQMSGGAASPSPAMPGDEDLGNMSLDDLQMRQAQLRLKNSKHPEQAQLQYQIFLRRRSQKQDRAGDREEKAGERESKREERERQKVLSRASRARSKQEREGNKEERASDREEKAGVKEALYGGAQLGADGQVVMPDGSAVDDDIAGDIKAALERKNEHQRAFGLGQYKPVKARASRSGRGRRSSSEESEGGSGRSEGLGGAQLLHYVERGGSLFDVPSRGRGKKGARGGSGGAADGDENGERTGRFDLHETGRSRGSDGIERVKVEGTLELAKDGRTLSGLAVGFRT